MIGMATGLELGVCLSEETLRTRLSDLLSSCDGQPAAAWRNYGRSCRSSIVRGVSTLSCCTPRTEQRNSF
jgi:hypothetical protein